MESESHLFTIKSTCNSSYVGDGQRRFPCSEKSWHFLSYCGCEGFNRCMERLYSCRCIEFAYHTENSLGQRLPATLCTVFNIIRMESFTTEKSKTSYTSLIMIISSCDKNYPSQQFLCLKTDKVSRKAKSTKFGLLVCLFRLCSVILKYPLCLSQLGLSQA